MQKLSISIYLCAVFVILASFKGSPVLTKETVTASSPRHITIDVTSSAASLLYNKLNLEEKGLSQQAFEYAYKGYQYLLAKNKNITTSYLTICDFSQSSKRKRLYLIDLESNTVVMNTWVAHGRNSGFEFATKFSNRPQSLQSSLGFYITRQTYYGAHGLSLRMDGLEPGFNDKAYQRAIVIHGAAYIGAERMNESSFMGRSFGCPAIATKDSKTLIETIKNGTLLFIYHPTENYLKGSKILNG